MIKINLLAERKTIKGGKTAAPGARPDTPQGGGGNFLLFGILLVGIATAVAWSWMESQKHSKWTVKVDEAERELVRLEEVRKKGDLFKSQKELLEKKIQLITDLKKKQSVPVHILDEISKNLPEFLWLDSMEATSNQISISGKATTYNAVSNFYDNLSSSGHFTGVDLGKTSEAPEGVSFSLTCKFQQAPEAAQATAGTSEPKPQG